MLLQPVPAGPQVVKRAAQEANYHTLYIALLDKMADKDLVKQMVKTTHYYVKVRGDSTTAGKGCQAIPGPVQPNAQLIAMNFQSHTTLRANLLSIV